MAFDHELICNAKLKPGTTIKQVVEALWPLLDRFGNCSRDEAIGTLRDGLRKEYGDTLRFDPATGVLEIHTSGKVSWDFDDAVSESADRVGPLTVAAGYFLLKNHDTADLDAAQIEYYFGPSESAITAFRFKEALRASLGRLSEFLSKEDLKHLSRDIRARRTSGSRKAQNAALDGPTREEIADYLRARVASGDLGVNDLIDRAVAYGLLPAPVFLDEMHERIQMQRDENDSLPSC